MILVSLEEQKDGYYLDGKERQEQQVEALAPGCLLSYSVESEEKDKYN